MIRRICKHGLDRVQLASLCVTALAAVKALKAKSEVRMEAAMARLPYEPDWARIVEAHLDNAIEAHRLGEQLLDRVHMVGLDLTDHESVLSDEGLFATEPQELHELWRWAYEVLGEMKRVRPPLPRARQRVIPIILRSTWGPSAPLGAEERLDQPEDQPDGDTHLTPP